MSNQWMPPSAEPVISTAKDTWQPGSAEPVVASAQQPQNPIVAAAFQPLAKTLTGNTLQNYAFNAANMGTIPQAQQRPFDSNVTAYSPLAQGMQIGSQTLAGTLGGLADQATTPANMAMGALVGRGAMALAMNPATRRFLQTQLPSLSADLLKANPMAPIYKTINGIQADITKPLPPSAPRLVQIGKNLADSINQSIETLGSKYKALIGENPLSQEEVASALPAKVADKLGIDPANIKTTADLWKARTDLSSTINDPWSKAELLKNTSLKENDVMDMMGQMKGLVMNKMDQPTRDSLDVLDNHYGTAISAGKGLLRSIINPATGEVKTGSLMNLFRKDSGAFAGKQDLLNKLNYFNSNVGKFGQQVNSHVAAQARNAMIKKAVGYTSGTGAAAWLGNKFILQPALKGAQSAVGSSDDSGN